MLARIMDTSDEWIRERSGVETRYYVEPGTATSDLGVAAAAQRARARAGAAKEEVDLVVFATMTPDHYFPGCGSLLQTKLGLRDVPCFDIRQQCTGFLYGLQLADAHIRAGLAQHRAPGGGRGPQRLHALDAQQLGLPVRPQRRSPPTPEEYAWNTRFRHLTVLFGDAGAAVVLKASGRTSGACSTTMLHTDGTDYDKLYVPGTGFKHRPYTDPEQFAPGRPHPGDGRALRLQDGHHAHDRGGAGGPGAQRRRGSTTWRMVLMHQANKRINEYCQKALGLPDEQGAPQHRPLRQHHGRHHPAPVGRVRARRAHQARATSCCWSPSGPG